MMPTKNGDRPIDSEASVIEPTRISDMTPTATPASASAITLLRDRPVVADVVVLVVPGLKRSLWVRSEKNRPAT